ncbi:sterol desaturase family protein [Paucibacter sp. APW11]|uniref:Sterol desaturase family protein n=1 Tax=Roseateles aquae TaxID=3077235 RepID=A0ABU3PHH4_9BURK|nr:sterol desaturase family protein [Paucibacter sp. APW11]MDT9001865.1 sterol desaturase family protein [Paucibacter sp. APW11]
MEFWLQLQQRLPPLAFDAIKFGNGLLLLLLILAPLERLFALRRRPRVWWRRPDLATDLAYYFLSSLLPSRLLALPLAALAWGLAAGLPPGWGDWSQALPAPPRFVLAFLVAECGFYWGHRAMHRWPLLWRLHLIHHSPAELDWLANTRAHPLDLVFTRLCGYVPLYLLGLAQGGPGQLDTVPLLISLAGSVWGYLIHANLRWRWRPLQRLIATPAFHHWHHERLAPGQAACNYAALLPLFDLLFGSYRVPAAWPTRYGIDEIVAPDLAGQLVQPFAGPPRLSETPSGLRPD